MQTDFDLETCRSALARLDEALVEREAQPDSSYIRDSVILRFTVAFETAASALRRYLDTVYLLHDALVMSPRRLIRHAARLELITDCEAWLRHIENRNRVSHAYLESMAIMVADGAAAFAAAARELLSAMERVIADGG